MTQTPWPTELRLSQDRRRLHVTFEDNASFDLSAEYLRVESPSAEVQGHSAGQKKTVGGKRSVTIQKIESVGNYAVRLIFDDGHSTGIYSWETLYSLGENEPAKWTAYLTALETQGLSRDA